MVCSLVEWQEVGRFILGGSLLKDMNYETDLFITKTQCKRSHLRKDESDINGRKKETTNLADVNKKMLSVWQTATKGWFSGNNNSFIDQI